MMFSLIINYYQPRSPSPAVRSSVIFAAELARRSDLVSEIIISDGSQIPDNAVSEWAADSKCRYLHHGSELSFAETYNAGVRAAQSEWIIIAASDIFIKPENYKAFQLQIQQCDRARLGCIIPYLTDSAYFPQMAGRRIPAHACTTPSMTINCNVFERTLYSSIGGVPDGYSGNYNDVVLAEKLHEQGRDILLAPTRVCHLGKMTVSGGSNVRLEEDKKKYFAEHPGRYNKNPITWDIGISFFFQSKGARFLALAVERLPESPVKRLISKLMFSLSHSL